MSKKRSIFEEVGNSVPQSDVPKTGIIAQGASGSPAMIRLWLMLLFVLVAIMIVVGGLTRLTDSGLSITEWAPVSGALPPMSHAAWLAEFEKYKAIPEFQIENSWMQMADFKRIYWWEWGHRQLGRLIGLVWAIGFLGFLALKKIPPGWTGKLLALGVLGGLQGVIGWWMVKSGLTGNAVDVAGPRLATHLGLAFIILAFISWFILQLSRPAHDLMQARRGAEPVVMRKIAILMGVLFLQILMGALVAAVDGGQVHNSWPMMSGAFLPADAWALEPALRNFTQNPVMLQFLHRILAYLLVLLGLWIWLCHGSVRAHTRLAITAACMMLALQVVLGIMTVLYGAPLSIAILHQIGGVLLWVLVIRAKFFSLYPKAQAISA